MTNLRPITPSFCYLQATFGVAIGLACVAIGWPFLAGVTAASAVAWVIAGVVIERRSR